MTRRTLAMRTVLIVVIVALIVGVGGPAFAKGPESATIIGPGIDEPIDLMDNPNQDTVRALIEQTGLWYATGRGEPLPTPPEGDLGPAYVLTWVNLGPPGEPVENRTIRQTLYLNAEGGPIIETPAQVGLDGWGPGIIGWFRAPDTLPDTLMALGVPIFDSITVTATSSSEVAEPPQPVGLDKNWYLIGAGLGLLILLAWTTRRRASILDG